MLISNHTKIGTPHEKTPVVTQTEMNSLIWLFGTYQLTFTSFFLHL